MLHVGRPNKEISCIICRHDEKAEEKNMMHFVIEGNALKTKREVKVRQLFILKKRVDELQIKKRKLI